MSDFLARDANPDLVEAYRQVGDLQEALYLLVDAIERGALTQGDVNQAKAALKKASDDA